MMKYGLKDLIHEIKSYDPHADLQLIEKAYRYAEHAHAGQKRLSGKDFISHPIEVAMILCSWKADTATICSAILHDVIEDSGKTIDNLKEQFGEEIAQLVHGETKLSKVVFESPEDYTAENIRKILLASIKDIRVLLIKLADRLHNMRTLRYFRTEKQKRISRETMDIYAPIAHKLGMYSLKGELEDLSLRHLHPKVYADLKKRIKEKRESREKKAQMIMDIVRKKLKENDVAFKEVSGRAKYFYSIFKKMERENKSFDEIYDLIAIRVIVDTIPDCYKVIAIMHQLWKPVPGRLKDYIAVPKSNGYQSLHTDVVTPFGSVLEIQARTLEMHHIAKYGVAAHWRYKKTERDKLFDKRISWLEQILDWKRKTFSGEFIESLKVDLFQDEIIVFTPKGDPIILPEGSTPVDFAYEVHTWVGNHCMKAEQNKKLVSLDTKLRNGDIISIITSNNARPSRSWLSSVKTNKAKQKIRNALNIETDVDPKASQKHELLNLKKFLIINGKKSSIKLSKCCNPQFGEDIRAFRTKDKKITIHKKECPNIHSLSSHKELSVRWNLHDKFIRTIHLYVHEKIGMVEKILNTLVESKVNVLSINMRPHKMKVMITLKIKAKREDEVDKTIKILKEIPEIYATNIEKTIYMSKNKKIIKG